MICRFFVAAAVFAAVATPRCPITAQSTARLEKVASTASDLDIGWIGTIAASRSGEIFVTDGKAQEIVVYDSTGRRKRTIGRRGQGPLEFQRLWMIAWLGDTLVAYDRMAMRLTYVKPDGRLLRTSSWTAVELPSFLLGAGGPALYALAYGQWVHTAGAEGIRSTRPAKSFLRIGADGKVSTLTSVSDATTDPTSSVCHSPSKANSYFSEETPTGSGPFNAFTSRGDFVSLSPGRAQMAWQLQAMGPIRVSAAYAPVAVTDALWARETKEYVDAERKEGGKLTCDPPMPKPATIPPIRSIVADDAGGLWVEVTTAEATRYDVYGADGKLAASLPAPVRRVQNIPFVVRGGKIYFAVRDADDVVSISVYRLRR